MAEVLVQFSDPVAAPEGSLYIARACGGIMPDGMWQGWIEFLPVTEGAPLRTGRETTQPNHTDLMYWASGLTAVYLEGALERALKPLTRPPEPHIPPPVFDGPLPLDDEAAQAAAPPDSILNPFSVYRKGEGLLRSQLAALSSWHLVNIIRDYELSDLSAGALNQLPASALIEIIVAAVREAEPTRAQ